LNRLNIKISFIFVFCFILRTPDLRAHPHVWIDVYLKEMSHVARGGISLAVKWKFDEMFTAQVIELCDPNKNSKIEEGELACIKSKFFDSLKQFDYFIELFLNNKKIDFVIKDFSASYIDFQGQHRVLYKFCLVLKKSSKKDMRFKLKFEDLTNFVAFTPKSMPVLSKDFKVVESKFDRMKNAYLVQVRDKK